MGCNKSKLQQRGPEAHDNGEHTSPWEIGQEAHSYYSENIEFNQNQISNNDRYHSGSSLNYHHSDNNFLVNSGAQSGYSGTEQNVTGSFGDAAPAYNPYNSFNNVQYLNSNEYSVNMCNQRSNEAPASNNYFYNDFSQENIHGRFSKHQYHNQQSMLNQEIFGSFDQQQVMGPPQSRLMQVRSNRSGPRYSRSLVRRSSFNDDYKKTHYQSAHNNTMVRHGSLEDIKSVVRNRLRNNFNNDDYLYRNHLVIKERYPRRVHPRRPSLDGIGRQRGLKRNSWDDDDSVNSNSTSSINSVPSTEPDFICNAGPRVKRRPSDLDAKSSDVAQDDKKQKEETDSEGKTNSNNETLIMRKRVKQLNSDNESFDALDLLMFPEEWSSCVIDRTGLVDISLTSPEGKSVQKYFNRSSRSKDFKLNIIAITRIENPFMHSYYLLKKQEMESRNERVDELYLYHGTKREHLRAILEDNLDWRLYSEKHRFGQGVSFSPLASYSSHYSDKTSEKVMLLFKVLASNSIGGDPNMRVPPIINNIVYDVSIKDDATVIVKYSDNEFYPLYKITYSKIMRNN